MLLSVVGTRPNLVKVSAVHRAAATLGIDHTYIDTGQHFDKGMASDILDSLDINTSEIKLKVKNLNKARDFSEAMSDLADAIEEIRPFGVLVYGDTNSTVLGGLTARKLGLQVGHIEAGLRSYNFDMQEEINREIVDALSNRLYAPTKSASMYLNSVGKSRHSLFAGDVALDLYFQHQRNDRTNLRVLVDEEEYIVVTIHRPFNVDDRSKLISLFSSLCSVGKTCKVVKHPRWTKQHPEIIEQFSDSNLFFLEPMNFVDLQNLVSHASLVITDSGGVQKDAYFNSVPCITFRNETEWPETLENDWNMLTRNAEDLKWMIPDQVFKIRPKPNLMSFGNGRASETILLDFLAHCRRF